MRMIRTAALGALGTVIAAVAQAQSVPTDLMDMGIAELLELKVESREQEMGEEQPWHDPGRFGISYRYVRSTFHGYRAGRNNVSDGDLLGAPDGTTYPILQDKIVQQAHSFDLGYAINRLASVHVVIPYIRQMSEHHAIAGGPDFEDFTIYSDGIGDVTLIGSLRAFEMDRQGVTVSAGLSFPSGSITEKGDTPLPGKKNQLPYTMQLGSGTYDVIMSAGYHGSSAALTSTGLDWLGAVGWGAQVLGKIRTGDNNRGYRLGHSLLISAWLSARPFSWLEPTLKLESQIWGRIHGTDDDFEGPIFPTPVADPHNFGGEKLALTGALTLRPPELPEGRLYDLLKRQAVSVSYGQPVYQSLNGPQPRELWRLSVDWSMDL